MYQNDSYYNNYAYKKFINLFIFIYFTLIFCTCSFASSWQIITSSTGLPSDKVNAFAASEKYMAVGTSLGVAIYDVESAKWFPIELPNQIASCEVKDLAIDNNKNLWIATTNGLAHMQGRKFYLYTKSEGLPNIDVERLFVKDNHIFVGCFGGFVAKAVIPIYGTTSFVPVNYISNDFDNNPKIKSVGISEIIMENTAKGWFATKGAGFYELHGANFYPGLSFEELPTEWVECLIRIKASLNRNKFLIGSSNGLALALDNKIVIQDALPKQGMWVTSMVTGIAEEILPIPSNLSESDKKLLEFLEKRFLWVATKNDGIWRFQDGRWRQYTSENSNLPSNTVNRLYRIGFKIIACTNNGLVIIPMMSSDYDEFKDIGLGNKFCKTIYPMPDIYQYMCAVNFISRGVDLWVAHEKGLSRFIAKTTLDFAFDKETEKILSGEEKFDKEKQEEAYKNFIKNLKEDKSKSKARKWQLFSKDIWFEVPNLAYSMYSNKITSMVATPQNHVWIIFENKHLARLRIEEIPSKSDPEILIDKPIWEWFKKSTPWPQDMILTCLMYHQGKLFVGTKDNGYYVLTNADIIDTTEEKYEWLNYNQLKGLWNEHVIGFAIRKTRDSSELAILHPDELTLYDGRDFIKVELGFKKKFTCIISDPIGNLWLGSETGLVKVGADFSVKVYTKSMTNLGSERITALAATIDNRGSYMLWVACDDSKSGSDFPPMVAICGGRKCLKEAYVMTSTLNQFDGRLWERWNIPGVRCLHLEGDYLFIGTNIRMRRLFCPVYNVDYYKRDIAKSDELYNINSKSASEEFSYQTTQDKTESTDIQEDNSQSTFSSSQTNDTPESNNNEE